MKNISIILVILIMPMLVYFLLSNNITNKSEIALADNTGKPTIIKFYSEMCLDCRHVAKEIDKIDPSYKNKVIFQNIDVQNNDKKTKELIQKYQIEVVPTMVFIDKSGKQKNTIRGFADKTKLEKYLKDLING